MLSQQKWLYALLGCLCALANAQVAATGAPPDSALLRLATVIETEDVNVRADFAAIALGEMIAAYELEFDKLSVPSQVSAGERVKQARWASAVQRFLEDLYAARDELDAGATVEVMVSFPASVQLLVGERMLSVASPHIEEPQRLDRRIVDVWCDSFGCDPRLLEPPESLSGNSPGRGAARGGWSFAAGRSSIYETRDGLGFMFVDVRQRSRKEQVCLQVAEELERLAKTLAAARRRGQRVDLQALVVKASGRGDDQLVVLSSSGQTVREHLPALLEAPDVVELARAWLAARSAGKPYRQLFPRADLLMAKLLSRAQ